jgi:hypothetical protein
MSKAERSLNVVGWVAPGSVPRRSVGRNKSRSRSNSILHHPRPNRDSQQPQEVKEDCQRRSVTIVEGRQRMLLFVDECPDDQLAPEDEKQVPLEVDEAISGLEG